jgi:nucleoside-diphosphate-sugar epimerase
MLAPDPSQQTTDNIFRAAKDAGCRRVIFASSVHAIEGYPRDRQLTPDDPVRPRNMYGVSKCFGEAVAHAFAVAEGLPSVCLRIGAYEAGPRRERGNSSYLSMFTSSRDLNSLILRSIEEPLPDAADGAVIVHATSDNRFKRPDLTKSRQVLGYAPQDDGFQLITLDEAEEWG